MNKKNGIEQVFQQSFQNFVEMPSDAVWAGLEGQLMAKNKKIRHIGYYKKSILIALSILFIGSSILVGSYMNDNPKEYNINTISRSVNSDMSNKPKNKFNQPSLVTAVIVQENNLEKPVVEEPKINIYSNNKTKITNFEIPKEKKHDEISSVVILYKNKLPFLKKNMKTKHFLTDHTAQLNGDQTYKIIRNDVMVYTNPIELNGEKENINNRVLSKMNPLEYLGIGVMSLEKEIVTLNTDPFIILNSKIRNFKRWSVSPYLRYAVTGRNIKGTSDETNFFELHESNSSAISYGLECDYKINYRWSLKSGLDLQKIGISSNTQVSSIYKGKPKFETMVFTSFNTNNIAFELENNSSYQNGDIINISGVFRQETTWIQIPLNIDYHYKKHKWAIDISSGISTNIFLNDNLTFEDSRNLISNFEHTFSERSAKTYVSYIGALNFHFLPQNHLDLFLGVYYQNALSSANKNKNVQYYPYSYGLQFGIEVFL